MDRRAFLRRLGVTLAAVAVAPAAAAQLLDRAPAAPAAPAARAWVDAFDEHELWPVGLMDCVTATSVHSISTNTVHEWNARLR